MKRSSRVIAVLAMLTPCTALFAAQVSHVPRVRTFDATLFHHVTAESTSPYNASIDTSTGNLTESGTTYICEYKPAGTTSNCGTTNVTASPWVHAPWLDTAQAFAGSQSLAYEIDSQSNPDGKQVDKVQEHIVSGDETTVAPKDGVKRYLGFALRLPSSGFAVPSGKFQVAQFWQGAPYGPPVCLEITGALLNGGGATIGVTWALQLLNNDTGGNPSSTPIVAATGSITFDQWTQFVIMVIPGSSGTGQVKIWQGGTQVGSTYNGKVGYVPGSYPYTPAPGTATNTYMDVFYGPYRDRQLNSQKMWFDEIRFADTYTEAVP